jgi:LL-diaminopimelate aminotransferase
VALDPASEILELGSAASGLASLALAFVEDGDTALVPALASPVFLSDTLLAGGETHLFPLSPENGYLPNLNAVPGDIVSRAKLVFLNYPGDPTGAVATREFFQQAVDFARETGVLIAHDASHAGIVYDGYRAPSILEASGASEVAVEFRALPGACGLPGRGIAYAAGSADAIRAMRSIQSFTGGRVAREAMAAALAVDNAADGSPLTVLQSCRDALVGGLNRLGWGLQKPKASYFVWAPVPPGFTSASFAYALLEKADILTVPGIAFGPQGEGFVRLSFGDEERINEAIDRIERKVSLNW